MSWWQIALLVWSTWWIVAAVGFLLLRLLVIRLRRAQGGMRG